MKWLGLILGIAALLLGGLWFLQGVGAIVIEPIACVGACEALEGPSLPWALGGAALGIIGIGLIWLALFRRR
ncbi:hypothetical protein O9Z70_10145 [Devosia sp. YIM 151766]|uniref:hypothetical protein n=1 Tax=Devosia sp. YIM 151766 TaxID=3017325 RepID=UPI00255CD4DC|nr:hypothetical protein [Devosia sp. YIM 151766]WIY51844.1 hypothetical protein O9Z70_10145 [Devosia sp. YIM 151766]